nr:MAG TPA: hypothetical protein [Bacteriophage sp.]
MFKIIVSVCLILIAGYLHEIMQYLDNISRK